MKQKNKKVGFLVFQILKYRNFIKMNLDLMELIIEINNLKTVAYVINLDEYADVGTYWIVLYVKSIGIT